MKLNKSALADFLGYSERALTDWQADGLPIERAGARGQEHVYDSAAVVAWLLEREARKVRGESARDDLYRSQKRLADMQIAEKEGVLVNARELEAGYARLVVRARTEFLQLPVLLAGHLEGKSSGEIQQKLDAEICEILAKLSTAPGLVEEAVLA